MKKEEEIRKVKKGKEKEKKKERKKKKSTLKMDEVENYRQWTPHKK